MLVVASFQATSAVFDGASAGLASEQITRIALGDDEVTNAVEWIEPGGMAPTQLQICDYCGMIGCASGGYAQLTRLAEWSVLVSPPRLDRIEDWPSAKTCADKPWVADEHYRAALIGRHGSAVVPAAVWIAAGFPPPDQLAPTELMDVYLAWVAELRPQPDAWVGQDILEGVRGRFIASHPAPDAVALEAVRAVSDHLRADPTAVAHASLLPIEESDERATALYLDKPDCAWWYAMVDGSPVPAFEGRFALVTNA